MSGGNAETRKWLDRFASPHNVTKAALEARRKIGSGEYLKARPEVDGTTPEGKAALDEWRAQAGIPKSHEEYLPKDFKIDDDAKPGVDSFLKKMHEADAPPTAVKAALEWRNAFLAEQAAQIAERDRANVAKAEDELRDEWGGDYRGNLTGIHTLLDSHGAKGLKEKFLGARYPDGTRFGDDPDTLRFLEAVSREINPQGTIAPVGGSDLGKSLDKEISDIEATMGTDAYWKDAGKQERYRELLTIKNKRAARAA